MEYKKRYYVIPRDSFRAEDRIFLEGEKYPVYDKNGNSLLVAENGEFYFTNDVMVHAIKEWGLDVEQVEDEVSIES